MKIRHIFMQSQTVLLSVLLLCLFTFIQGSMTNAEDVQLPWASEAVQEAMTVGTVLIYTENGTDSNGNDRDCRVRYEIISVDDAEVNVKGETMKADSDTIIGTKDGSYAWPKDGTSPFFYLMRPKIKPLQQEEVTVPAGTFPCVVVELKGMFDMWTVWMIEDKPGIYAKVVEGELIYELKEIQLGKE